MSVVEPVEGSLLAKKHRHFDRLSDRVVLHGMYLAKIYPHPEPVEGNMFAKKWRHFDKLSERVEVHGISG